MARWMYTDALTRVGCPKCCAGKGSPCRSPSGRKCDSPHIERIVALRALPDFNPSDYMIRPYKVADIFKRE